MFVDDEADAAAQATVSDDEFIDDRSEDELSVLSE